jgi:hypothetical protein
MLGHGEDSAPSRHWPDRLNTGLTLVGKGSTIPGKVKIGRNVVVQPHARPESFKAEEVASGETVEA